MKNFLLFALVWLLALPAGAQAPAAPDQKILELSNQVLERIRQDKDLQAGDPRRVSQLVDELVMPHVNFERMTSLAVGRNWRQATPEQQKQLMAEFRTLLLRTYSGALSAVKDQKVRLRPSRSEAGADDVIVRTELVQDRGEPIQLDYRLERNGNDWRIYDVNVMGVWLVEAYRNQFTQEIGARGIDGLIKSLADRNRQPQSQTQPGRS